MKLEQINIENLIPYINNARTHSEEQVTQIASSIKEFGFNNPILVDGENGIIAGHGRLLAAKKLNYKTVPVIELKHLSEVQKKAYILADNKLAENAGWDDALVSVELEALSAEEFDISLTGFDGNDYLKDDKEDIEDNVPEPPEEPITKLGDLWILGEHRLLCGDSTDIDHVGRLMAGSKADMVFTDPPYGLNYQSNMRTKSDKFSVLKNDDSFLDIAPIIDRFSSGWVFIWTSWKVQNIWVDIFKEFSYPTNMIVWHKPGGGIGDLKKTFSSDYEVALVWHRGAELCGRRIGSVWTISKDAAIKYVHPTQKPVALPVEAIDKTTISKAIVLDIFLGSGSTLIACEKTNRKCYGMELDPKYCDVIVKRWEEYTGKKATLEDGG